MLVRVLLLLNVFLWLVRDASLQSFVLYSVFVNVVAYFLVMRGEPFSLAVLVESAASVAAKTATAQAHSATNQMQQPHQQQQAPMASSPLMSPPQQPMRSQPLAASSSSSSSSISSAPSHKVSPPAPVAFAFNHAKASDAASAASPSLSTHAESQSAVSADADLSASSPSSSPVKHSHGLHPIEPANMPQTPSVEPVITPMPVHPSASDMGASAAASSSSHSASVRLPTESTPVVLAGATARFSSTDSTMCWGRADGSSYDVRVGPNYKKYGKKQPSRAAMFECVGVDVFGAPDGKLDHIAAHLQLPWIAKSQHSSQQSDDADAAAAAADPESLNLATAAPIQPPPDCPTPPHVMDPVNKASVHKQTRARGAPAAQSTWHLASLTLRIALHLVVCFFCFSWDHYELDPRVLSQDDELGVPTLFIINFQIPTYAPGWVSSREDGEGFSILLYFQITAATRSEIRSGRLSGAVQLFKDFVANAHEFEFHSRFKCIPRIANPGEAKVGYAARQAMRMYNSKPFLTGPRQSNTQGEEGGQIANEPGVALSVS